ncbi:MAG: helix-turn-helix domain-containing protein [Gemmatimonadaceae bacterium]
MLLRHLLDQGLSKAAIAAQLGVSRRVIYYWLTTGQLDRDVSAAGPRVRKTQPTKLTPYHGIITARLETFPETERHPALR